MKVFSVCGVSHTGKTTTVEGIIRELRKRNYTVGSIKDIHFEAFTIDTEGTNTYKHRQAGAQQVTARGKHETDIIIPRRMDLYEIQRYYNVDYLVIEGMGEANVPHIVTATTIDDIECKLNDRVFMVSGRIADEIEEYKDLPAYSVLTDVEKIVDCIEEKTFELLPDFDENCCGACGMSCRAFCSAIVKGERRIEECVLNSSEIQLKINGSTIQMVPFVQRILKNAITGVVSELDGWEEKGLIEISMGKAYEGDKNI